MAEALLTDLVQRMEASMQQAAANPTKDFGPWVLRLYKDRSVGSKDSDVAFEYTGSSFQWTDLEGLCDGESAGRGHPGFKYKCHGEPREGSLPDAFLRHRKLHPGFHNDFHHSSRNIYNLFRGLAGLERHVNGNINARLPCGQAFGIFFTSGLTIGRREDSTAFL